MADHKTIAITGATGFVGRHIAAELLTRGYALRALVRDRAEALETLGHDPRLDLVVGDIQSESDCRTTATGADACIHLVGIIREKGSATFERLHTNATRHIVDACEAAGIRRYIHMSALGASPHSQAEYARTKFEAERVVRNSSLDWTIFRPAMIHGPGGEFTHLAVEWARGTKPPHFFLPYFTRTVTDETGRRTEIPVVAPVFVDDVTVAFASALESDAAIGEVIALAGPEELDFADMLRAYRDSAPNTGAKLEAVGIPGQIAAMKAKMAAMIGVGSLLPFDEGMAIMASQDATADLTKARKQLHFSPAPFRAALAAYAHTL